MRPHPIVENLQKADDCTSFVMSDLQTALKTANATEALMVLQLISKAAALSADLAQLLAAVNETRASEKVPA